MELYIRVSLNVANAFQRLCDHRLNSLKQDMFLPHSLVFHDFPGVEAVKRRCPNTMSSSCIFGGVHLQFPHWVFPALRQPSNLVYSSVTEGLVVNCWAAHSDMMHQVQKLDWIFGPVYAVTLITDATGFKGSTDSSPSTLHGGMFQSEVHCGKLFCLPERKSVEFVEVIWGLFTGASPASAVQNYLYDRRMLSWTWHYHPAKGDHIRPDIKSTHVCCQIRDSHRRCEEK